MKYTNASAFELFNTLNNLNLVKGSHCEYAATKTLRKMKEWVTKANEKLKDIDDDNCAIEKNDKGVEVRIMQTLTRTNPDGSKEEFQVNTYTKEGEKKRVADRRDFMKAEVIAKFEVHQTSDGANLSAYEKIALEELGFYNPDSTKEKGGSETPSKIKQETTTLKT